MERTFPFFIKNIAGTVLYCGSLRLEINQIIEVPEHLYNANKVDFEICFDRKYIEETTKRKKAVADKEKAAAEEAKLEEAKTFLVNGEESIVAKVKSGKLHWNAAKVELLKIKDVGLLEKLYAEGEHLDFPVDHIIMRSILSQIQAIKSLAQ